MATNLDLCFTTGTEAIQAFKAKKLSPVELMNAVINRCEEVNPKLNAITYRFFERARTKAKEAEQRYIKSPGDVLPLEGLPVAIKDFHPVKDEIATLGSKIFEHNRPGLHGRNGSATPRCWRYNAYSFDYPRICVLRQHP